MAILKRLDPNANSFHANGHKYLIHGSLSIARYREFERLQVIAGFGADYQTLYQRVSKAYGEINQMKAADAAVTLNSVLEGLNRPLSGQEPPMLMLCSLFIAREEEELSRWTESEAIEKIRDWELEGYDTGDFFNLALRSVRLFHNAYAAPSLSFSEESQ